MCVSGVGGGAHSSKPSLDISGCPLTALGVTPSAGRQRPAQGLRTPSYKTARTSSHRPQAQVRAVTCASEPRLQVRGSHDPSSGSSADQSSEEHSSGHIRACRQGCTQQWPQEEPWEEESWEEQSREEESWEEEPQEEEPWEKEPREEEPQEEEQSQEEPREEEPREEVGLGVRGLLSRTCTRSPARLLLWGFDGFLSWAQWHRWPLGTDLPLQPLSFRSWEGGGRAKRENSSPLSPKWVLLVTSPHPQVSAPPPTRPPDSHDKRHLCRSQLSGNSRGAPGARTALQTSTRFLLLIPVSQLLHSFGAETVDPVDPECPRQLGSFTPPWPFVSPADEGRSAPPCRLLGRV